MAQSTWKCMWSDQETDDNVMGSGAEMHPWYASSIGFDSHTDKYVVTMEDPKTTEEREYMFTRNQVREAVTKAMNNELALCDLYVSYFRREDTDGPSMDCIVQQVAYGSIVFG